MTTLPDRYAFLDNALVVPVMVIDRIEHAVPLARALVEGGLTNLEITLRTDCALDAIRAIVDQVPDAVVGAGTVLNIAQLESALAAGAEFIVSPGMTEALLSRCAAQQVALLPGAVTASEVMTALAHGFSVLKFFPAGTSGGPGAIKALGGPFKDVLFMPTGGVNPDNLADYLSLPNVLAAGGSWMIPQQLVADADWPAITRLAREAVALAADYAH